MGRITEECVHRIKAASDIVEVINRYVPLRRAGSAWKACCPFHPEKTPSFSVNPSRQTFKCFGCGVGGDAVKFVMMFENLDYPSALRKLADFSGVTVAEEQESAEVRKLRKHRARIIETNRWAADWYHRLLRTSPRADHVREYLKSRGFGLETVKNWQMGWAPADSALFLREAERRNISAPSLREAFLLAAASHGEDYAVFRDRLMFPIHNLRGEVVGFSGRILHAGRDPRKYVNTAETPAFRKGGLLFGLHKATRAIAEAGYTALLCEGQLDVVACHEKAGLRNAVAALGTSFTDEHALLLRKYAARVVLCFDGDGAGMRAGEKAYRRLAAVGMEVFQTRLTGGEDPDSLIRTQGADALRTLVAAARPYLEVRADQERAQAGDDVSARAAMIPLLIDLAAEMKDPNQRDVAVADLASRLNKGLDEMREAAAQAVLRKKRERDSRRETAVPDAHGKNEEDEDDAPPADAPPVVVHRAVLALCRLFTCNPECQQLIIDRVEELQEPIHELSGGVVLQRLLEAPPAPGDAEAWRLFLASLPPEQAAGLREIEPALYPLDRPEYYVQEACGKIARATLRQKQDVLMARLAEPSLPDAERLKLMRRSMEIRRMLIGTV